MDLDLIRYVDDVLAAPVGSLTGFARKRRLESIEEAKAWPSGPSVKQKLRAPLYSHPTGYQVSLAKPGKEAAPGYEPLNVWDMTPVVHYRDGKLDYLPSFSDLFAAIQSVSTAGKGTDRAVGLLGHLFARNAYMLDHHCDAGGGWRYRPNEQILALIQSDAPFMDGLPLEVFLQVVEAIALNEDVKYTERTGTLSTAGRVNTMLTFAHLCAVFTDRASLADFAGAFARPPIGVSPLAQFALRSVFPLLEPDSVRFSDPPPALTAAQRALERFIGLQYRELSSIAGGSPVSPTNKGRLRLVVDRLLGGSLGERTLTTFSSCSVLKVIRVKPGLLPAEDVSFAPFDIAGLLSTPWPKSEFRADVVRPMLFVVFADHPKGDEQLIAISSIALPLEEIETNARLVWKRAVEALRAARRDLLPKSSEGSFFVRNHAGKKVVNEAGHTVTPLSFWLSRHLVQQLLLRAGSERP
ncbi:MAG: hypothetical protein IBX63_11380 [Coriobacteriia bacterium]|nr:hypothetical protein [Coriobacteriia bacterium]